MPSDPVVAEKEMADLLPRGGRTSFDPDWFEHGGRRLDPEEIVAILDPHLTEARRRRIDQVLDGRTYRTAVVIEGMVDTGNASAVMRSAEAFGVQVVHAIDDAGAYKNSRRTSQGAHKWLDRYVWSDAHRCVAALRADRRRIIAAHPDPDAPTLHEVDLSRRCALVFGNEQSGLSAQMLDAVDEVFQIPMDGFSRSLNISVAAGIVLAEARRQRRAAGVGALDAEDRLRLRAVWTLQSVAHAEQWINRALGTPPG